MLDFAMLGAGWVLWLLVALSVLCVGVAIERAIEHRCVTIEDVHAIAAVYVELLRTQKGDVNG